MVLRSFWTLGETFSANTSTHPAPSVHRSEQRCLGEWWNSGRTQSIEAWSKPTGFSAQLTVQSFEHGKTPVVTAVFGVLATQEFWDRGAVDIRTKNGPPHLFSRSPYSSSRGTESNPKGSSHEGDRTLGDAHLRGLFLTSYPLILGGRLRYGFASFALVHLRTSNALI